MNRYIGVRVRFLPVPLFVLLAFSLLTGISGFAAPGAAGDLDSGFGDGGKVVYRAKDLAPVNVVGFAMQGDGKAILASNSDESIVLARHNPDGSLDPGFGGDGIAVISQEAAGGVAQKIALQADGKIVIVIRQFAEGNTVFVVLRLRSNGSIDATFGDKGKVSIAFAANSAVAGQVAVSGDKIIIAGALVSTVPRWQVGLAQLNSDGTLDSGFSGDGMQVFDVGATAPIYPSALVVDSTGRMVISNIVPFGSSDTYNIVTRLTPAGDLDPAFGVGGKAEVRFVEGASQFSSAAIDDLGRIVLAGNVAVSKGLQHARDFAVARLLDNGALDTSFGAAGRVHTDYFEDEDLASSVIVLPGGGLVVGGIFSEGGGDPAFGLVVYGSDGTLDGGFGAGGKVRLRFPGIGSASGFGLALTPDGKILQAGSAFNSSTPPTQLALARFLPNGALDNSFSGDGLVVTPVILPGQVDPVAALLQSSGKIVVAGATYYNHTVLVRFNADGSLDRSFGENGEVRADFGSGIEIARALTSDSSGRLIVAANGNSPGNPRIVVLRFSADGVLDRSFGQGGKATLDSPPSSSAEAVAVDQAGRIIVAGGVGYPVNINFGLARFNADGTIDRTFGVAGTVTLSFGTSDFGDNSQQVNSLAVGADGKILLAGGFAESFALTRFNDDGRLDITFGDEGKLLIPYGGPTTRTSAMELLPDGKILLAGVTGSNIDGTSGVLLRLDAYGVRDPSFGSSGAVTENVPYLVNDLAVQADGKIVLGGASVARYNSDGSPDVSFGNSGVAAIPFSDPSVAAVSVLIAPEGRIVIAGAAVPNIYFPDHQFHLAAYRADNAAPTSTPTSLPASPTPTSGPGCRFSDVCGSDYFAAPVDYLLERGAVSGYADNTFRPFADTTRSQLAKIVVIATALPLITPAAPTFNDVDEQSPFYSYVETAAAWGLIAGYGDGTFRPGFPVTRGQLSKIIVVAEGWSLVTPLASSFSDVSSDNPFYSYIETALAHGIISGYGEGTFRWNLGATRGQIAKIVYLAETGAARK